MDGFKNMLHITPDPLSLELSNRGMKLRPIYCTEARIQPLYAVVYTRQIHWLKQKSNTCGY